MEWGERGEQVWGTVRSPTKTTTFGIDRSALALPIVFFH